MRPGSSKKILVVMVSVTIFIVVALVVVAISLTLEEEENVNATQSEASFNEDTVTDEPPSSAPNATQLPTYEEKQYSYYIETFLDEAGSGWSRLCEVSTTEGGGDCNPWEGPQTVNVPGMTNEIGGYGAYLYVTETGEQRVRQSVIEEGTNKSSSRTCSIDLTQGKVGTCTSWSEVMVLAVLIDGATTELPVIDYGAVSYPTANSQKLIQSLLYKEGTRSRYYFRVCDIDSNGLATNCPTGANAWLEVQDPDPSVHEPTGASDIGGYGVYYATNPNGDPIAVKTKTALDGTTGWHRTCNITQDELDCLNSADWRGPVEINPKTSADENSAINEFVGGSVRGYGAFNFSTDTRIEMQTEPPVEDEPPPPTPEVTREPADDSGGDDFFDDGFDDDFGGDFSDDFGGDDFYNDGGDVVGGKNDLPDTALSPTTYFIIIGTALVTISLILIIYRRLYNPHETFEEKTTRNLE